MKTLLFAIALALSFASVFVMQSMAGGAHVAQDWTGAYVPAQLQSDNAIPGFYVATSWADAYMPQQLQGVGEYKGGFVAASWAEAYAVQKPQNSDRCYLYIQSS